MKMYFKSLILALAGVLAMTACSNEMEEQLAENGKNGQNVKFSIGVENLSRTAIADGTLVTSFEQNDEIGIFAYDGEKLVSSNVKYTYNGSEWTSENAIAAQDGVKLSYYAYYPYDASVTDPASIKDTVSADQTAGFGKNDMLSARNTEAAAGATNISLKFAHAMAMVQVSLMEGTTSDANATVTLQSILPVTSVNAKDGSVTAASGASVGVAMKKAAESLTYRAVVPEQTIKAGSKLLTIVADGKTFNVTFDADVKYERGKFLQITVNKLNALPDGAEVTISGKLINGWAPGENPEGGETEEVPLIQKVNDFPEVSMDTREFTQESWFQLRNSDGENYAIFDVVDDNSTTWGKAIKLTYDETTLANSWYRGAIGYHHTEPMYVKDTYIYKVTAKIKAETCDDAGKIVSKLAFTCKSKDLETTDRYKCSFAMGTSSDACTVTSLGVTPQKAGTWETYTFYIDFSHIASNVSPDASKVKLSETTEKDYNGFDLRVYTNNSGKKPVIYISDVTMEPYQE
ncbi:fimbrillin family protein [Phocaeicola plebeius]|uniref:fimbrillin family protein n=1 Tax=Phocaeicola plebeius TaxID=310297 RepID=UPI002942E7D9|nr:fimbrillin family protein [Phocaeicola plebeius]